MWGQDWESLDQNNKQSGKDRAGRAPQECAGEMASVKNGSALHIVLEKYVHPPFLFQRSRMNIWVYISISADFFSLSRWRNVCAVEGMS